MRGILRGVGAWSEVRQVIVVLGLLLTTAGGCGDGGGLNMNVRKPANERPDVDQGTEVAGIRRIPADEGFNLTSFTSGQAGTARGRAESVGADGALCAAEARDGGTAWGEFQLGYCFDNKSRTPLEATVRLRLKVAAATSALSKQSSPGPAASPQQAKSLLAFFIKDTNGLVLRKETLQEADLEKGSQSATRMHDLVYDVCLEPGRGYYLVIGGRTDVEAHTDQTVSCTVSVSEATLEVTWRVPDGRAAPLPVPQGETSPSTTPAAGG